MTQRLQADSHWVPRHAAGKGKAKAVQAVKSSLQMVLAHEQQQLVMSNIRLLQLLVSPARFRWVAANGTA